MARIHLRNGGVQKVRRISLLLLLSIYLAIAQEVWVKEGNKETAIGNAYFTLYLFKEKGWLLDRLEDKRAGVIASDCHIYTDWGIYPRGYVGSREEKDGVLKIERQGDEVIADAEGELKGQGMIIEEPIRYKVRYRLGKEARLGVDVELQFQGKPREVSAFLAQVLVIPSVRQWVVNGLDGLISEDMGDVIGRCWESRDEPLSIENPYIWVLTKWGSLRIEGIRSQPKAQNIFLYDGGNGNLVFFFGFMDGGREELKSFEASFEIVRLR